MLVRFILIFFFIGGSAMAGERKYSLCEIDAMRAVFQNKLRPPPLNLTSGSYLGDAWGDHQKYVDARMKEAEEQLRTFMIGNGDPAELLALKICHEK